MEAGVAPENVCHPASVFNMQQDLCVSLTPEGRVEAVLDTVCTPRLQTSPNASSHHQYPVRMLVSVTSTSPVRLGKWSHVCVVVDDVANEVCLYVDGKPEGSAKLNVAMRDAHVRFGGGPGDWGVSGAGPSASSTSAGAGECRPCNTSHHTARPT